MVWLDLVLDELAEWDILKGVPDDFVHAAQGPDRLFFIAAVLHRIINAFGVIIDGVIDHVFRIALEARSKFFNKFQFFHFSLSLMMNR